MQELTINLRQVKWKSVEKLVEQTAQAFKVLLEWTGNMHFCTICDVTFLFSVLENQMWSLKSLWKVLNKWLQFFVWTLAYYSSLGFTNKQTSHMCICISWFYEFKVAFANSLYITCHVSVILLILIFLVFQPITVKMVTGKWEDDILEKLSQNTIFLKFHIN